MPRYGRIHPEPPEHPHPPHGRMEPTHREILETIEQGFEEVHKHLDELKTKE